MVTRGIPNPKIWVQFLVCMPDIILLPRELVRKEVIKPYVIESGMLISVHKIHEGCIRVKYVLQLYLSW